MRRISWRCSTATLALLGLSLIGSAAIAQSRSNGVVSSLVAEPISESPSRAKVAVKRLRDMRRMVAILLANEELLTLAQLRLTKGTVRCNEFGRPLVARSTLSIRPQSAVEKQFL